MAHIVGGEVPQCANISSFALCCVIIVVIAYNYELTGSEMNITHLENVAVCIETDIVVYGAV